MSDLWEWFNDRMEQYEEEEDEDRLEMVEIYQEGADLMESDPLAMIEAYQQAKAKAISLDEPWWTYFFDTWISIGYEEHVGDLQKGLIQALHCVNEGRKPILKDHPWRMAAYNSLLSCYVKIDPIGYAEAIEETVRELSEELPPGGSEHRYVLMEEHARYLLAVGDFERAKEVTQQHLAIADDDLETSDWYVKGAMMHSCRLAWHDRDWESLQAFAERAEELLLGEDAATLDAAEAKLWQAGVARDSGEDAEAQRLMRQATRRAARVEKQPSPGYYDALVAFHEIGENLEQALSVREEQLTALQNKGRFGYECETHLRRCDLLAQLGRLTEEDLARATEATQPLKKPEVYRERIERLRGQLSQ